MKKYGVVGHLGKLGRLLLERPNFVPIDCNITDRESIKRGLGNAPDLNVIVNCAAVSSIDACEADYDHALKVNVHGLSYLHKEFGSRVLNISTDQVFSGKSWFLPKENSFREPVNNYGYTKLGAETISQINGGKTIRISRTVSMDDPDIHMYWIRLAEGNDIAVPTFFKRNYLTRNKAVNGIEFFVNNYDRMPRAVNYGSLDNVSYYRLMDEFLLAAKVYGEYLPGKVLPRKQDVGGSPRPKWGGFNVTLAKKLGFPMYKLSDTVSELVEEI